MDFYKKEILSPTLKIVTMMIEYPEIYKSINISSLQEFQPNQSCEFTEGNNLNNIVYNSNNNSNKYKNYNGNFIQKDNDKINNFIKDKYNKNKIGINQMSKSGEVFSTLSCEASQENLSNFINQNEKNFNNTHRILNKEHTPLRNKEYFSYDDEKNSKTNPRNYKRNNIINNNNNNNSNNNYLENNSNLNNQSEYISQQELNNNMSNLYLNVPTDNNEVNIKNPNSQIPIDLRYKSEKRIYRNHSRHKSKDNNYNENNDMILSNNNIDLMGSSDGDNEMKFKPSYQIQNINDNNNNIRRNNFNIFQMKNENNKNTKVLNQHRVFNEDFLNDDYNYNKK